MLFRWEGAVPDLFLEFLEGANYLLSYLSVLLDESWSKPVEEPKHIVKYQHLAVTEPSGPYANYRDADNLRHDPSKFLWNTLQYDGENPCLLKPPGIVQQF